MAFGTIFFSFKQTQEAMKYYDGSLHTLNELVKANNDRIMIYKRAIRDINDHDLKQTFLVAVEESRRIVADLGLQIFKRDSIPDIEATSTLGKFYLIWLEVRELFIDHDQVSLLRACEFAEYMTQITYKHALEYEDLEWDLSKLIYRQKESLRISDISVRTSPSANA